MTAFLYRLGRGAVRRRRLTVLAWALLAVGIIVLGQAAGGRTSDTFEIPGVESQRALDVLEEDFPSEAGTSAQLVFAVPDGDAGTLSDRAAARAVDDAYERLEATANATNAAGAVRLELGGDLPTEAANEPPEGQEVVGLVMAVVVLLVAFGSVIAMGLPIGLALVGLAASLGLITLIAAVVEVNTVAPTLA